MLVVRLRDKKKHRVFKKQFKSVYALIKYLNNSYPSVVIYTLNDLSKQDFSVFMHKICVAWQHD